MLQSTAAPLLLLFRQKLPEDKHVESHVRGGSLIVLVHRSAAM